MSVYGLFYGVLNNSTGRPRNEVLNRFVPSSLFLSPIALCTAATDVYSVRLPTQTLITPARIHAS